MPLEQNSRVEPIQRDWKGGKHSEILLTNAGDEEGIGFKGAGVGGGLNMGAARGFST